MLPALSIDGPIATLTLRRPATANALTPEDLPAIREHLHCVNATPEVLVLVLRSEGKHFCSGYDIAQVAGSQVKGQGFGDMVDALEDCRAVTVAAIQGGVYGGATDMALACDFRIGTPRVNMFMPAARLGLHFYASGMRRYVSRLGIDMAKRLFLTGEKREAEALLQCGFLTDLVAEDALDHAVAERAHTLSQMAPLPLLGMKHHLNRIAHGMEDVAAIEAEVQRTIASHDLQEGGRAWREKRDPVFQGR